MRKSIILCVVLMTILSMSTAMAAIAVDGYKSTNEWDENWAFAQDHATTYNEDGPFGDRLVIRQGLYEGVYQTNLWYDTDPKNDSGESFGSSMASFGESSGFDISNIYGHYDFATDTVYGLTEVYGIPGDLDGNGDVTTVSPADTAGPIGPAGTGLGATEYWRLRMIQDGTTTSITLIENDWEITGNGLTYADIDARFTIDQANSVYEISLSNISEHYSILPGTVLAMELIAGSSADVPGEDTAIVFIQIPNPQIDIEKHTNGVDADNPRGPSLNLGDTVTWEYIVTNTDDVPLENIVVNDDKIGAITLPKTTLAPQESMTATATGTVTEYGQYENEADVTGEYNTITVSDMDPSHYYCPPPPPVPALTPAGLLVLIGLLGIIGIIGVKRRD